MGQGESTDAGTEPSALLRAVEYVRMSTEHQQYSTENQADKIREYATRRGIQIVRVQGHANTPRVFGQALTAESQIEHQHLDGRCRHGDADCQRAQHDERHKQHTHGQHAAQLSCAGTEGNAVKPCLNAIRQPAESHQRVRAPRFTEQPVEQQCTCHDQRSVQNITPAGIAKQNALNNAT